MSFVLAGAIVAGTTGLVKVGVGIAQKNKAKKRQAAAKEQMEADKDAYRNAPITNPYDNMENTMEDLTVDTQAADFAAQYAKALTDLAEVEESRAAALGTGKLKAADVNSLSTRINDAVGVRFSVGANGTINIIKGQSYNGATQAKINQLLDEALQHLQATGSIPDAFSLVQERLSAIVEPGGEADSEESAEKRREELT